MARTSLSQIAAATRIEVEMTALLCDSRMEDHLKQEIAEFVLQMRHVALLDRVRDFVGFLDV